MEVLALSLGDIVATVWSQWIGPILQLVIGLALVVFIHELGHFLAAKWVDIKVERFALGFGPRLLGFKWGETDYCIKLLPLGGYVKMLGQEDFQALTEENRVDPRSFEAKTVGARFFVIAAGVVMNVILAAILFVIVGLVGMNFAQPVVGSTSPTYPASTVELTWSPAEATAQAVPAFTPGLKPGDRIVELNGKEIIRFADVQMESIAAFSTDEKFDIVVERTDPNGRKWVGRGPIGVKMSASGMMLVFGMRGSADTVFALYPEDIISSPFQQDDRLVSIGGEPITHHWDIGRVEKTLTGAPVQVTIERGGQTIGVEVQPTLHTAASTSWKTDGTLIRGYQSGIKKQDDKTIVQFELLDGGQLSVALDDLAEVEMLDILGMSPRIRVLSVSQGSPANDANILPGDIIAAYGDRGPPTRRKLLAISEKVAGSETPIVLLRDGKLVQAKVTPKKRGELVQIGITAGIDLMHPEVAGIRKGSPAELAKIEEGDRIEKVNGQPVASWIDVFAALKASADKDAVELTIRRGEQELAIEIGQFGEFFSADDYSMSLFPAESFERLQFKFVKRNPFGAMVWGAGETWNFIIKTYATLRGLVMQTVSTETLSGPAGIVRLAIRVGREEPIVNFVYFMAFISATLAVINFLPLPVVDGGIAVFLLIEKIRRKPIPTKVINMTQMVGLALLGLAFVLLTWQDISRWISSLW